MSDTSKALGFSRFIDSHWAVIGVLVLALVFRLGTGAYLGFNAPPDRDACGADTVEFEQGAWNLAQGNGFILWNGGQPTAYRAPGYPVMLAGLYRLFGRQYWVNRLALSVIGTLTCLVVYRLALALRLGRRVALCGMLVAALHPLQAYFCGHFMSEVPATFLNVLVTLLLVKGMRVAQATDCSLRSSVIRHPSSVFLLAGLLNGLSVLVRPAAIFMVPILGGLLVLQGWRRPVRAIVLAMMFGLGTLAAVAPWSYRNWVVLERFSLVSTTGGAVFWGANNELTSEIGGGKWGYWVTTSYDVETKKREVWSLPNEVDRDRREWELGKAYLRQNPGKIPGLLLGKVYRAISPFPLSANRVFVLMTAVSQIVMLLLCSIGLYHLLCYWRGGENNPISGRSYTLALHLPVLAQFLTLVATVLIFYGSERFRVPYEAILSVYAGMGLMFVCSYAVSAWHRLGNAHRNG